MTTGRLSRRAGVGRPAAPVRLVHLGAGNFFRAHQAWYTDQATDADSWGYAGFSGRSAGVAADLGAQDGLYSLVTRGPDRDRSDIVSSLSRVHPAGDHDAWLDYFRAPDLAALTLTVTEAGYLRRPTGGLDVDRPEIQADITALRTSSRSPVRTAPGRLIAGMIARSRTAAGPVTLVPCDNLPANGQIAEEVLRDLAHLVDFRLGTWMDEAVTVVSTVVDRITPHPSEADRNAVARSTGWQDCCPVVTEPFHEWVLSGVFPAGRPRWEDAGATFVDDLVPYERRKLWLLNGAHSLLAYAGSILGHATIPAAVADPTCQAWLDDWWTAAAAHLEQPKEKVTAYRRALLERFANTRMADRLSRIAEDGSQKLPVRILPVLRAERAAGRLPLGATRVLAAWICHLRGLGAPVKDVRAAEVVPLARGALPDAVAAVLTWLDPDIGADPDVRAAVADQSGQLAFPTHGPASAGKPQLITNAEQA